MTSTEGPNTASTEYEQYRTPSTRSLPAVSNPEILGYREHPQYKTSKYCEYSQYVIPNYHSI